MIECFSEEWKVDIFALRLPDFIFSLAFPEGVSIRSN
jgi:hypothetical protein